VSQRAVASTSTRGKLNGTRAHPYLPRFPALSQLCIAAASFTTAATSMCCTLGSVLSTRSVASTRSAEPRRSDAPALPYALRLNLVAGRVYARLSLHAAPALSAPALTLRSMMISCGTRALPTSRSRLGESSSRSGCLRAPTARARCARMLSPRCLCLSVSHLPRRAPHCGRCRRAALGAPLGRAALQPRAQAHTARAVRRAPLPQRTHFPGCWRSVPVDERAVVRALGPCLTRAYRRPCSRVRRPYVW
jgi:hypothetical protein